MYRNVMPYHLTMSEKGIVRNGIGFEPDENRIVRGYFTTDKIDFYGHQIVKDASIVAMTNYLPWGNVRNMHLPEPVARVVEYNPDVSWNHMAAKVVDEAAWNRVTNRLYNGFSIGAIVLSADFVPMSEFEEDSFSLLTPSLRRVLNDFGLVFKITELEYVEISLVDIPANAGAVFTGIEKNFTTGPIGNGPSIQISTNLYSEGVRGIKNGRIVSKSFAGVPIDETKMNGDSDMDKNENQEVVVEEASLKVGDLAAEDITVVAEEVNKVEIPEAPQYVENSAFIAYTTTVSEQMNSIVEQINQLRLMIESRFAEPAAEVDVEVGEKDESNDVQSVENDSEHTDEMLKNLEGKVIAMTEKLDKVMEKLESESVEIVAPGKATVAVESDITEPPVQETKKLTGEEMVRFIALKSATFGTIR